MKRINLLIATCAISFVVLGFVANAKHATINQADSEEKVKIGDKAPDLKFKTPDGKFDALSDLKGQVVLVDFWASWCGPCRGENPNVVAAYNKYKDKKFKGAKGFTIFSVSLDQNHDAWVNAIAKDKLSWTHHVSDLQGWYSAAARLYGVNSIPTNFLIDANGVVIAKSLRGPYLERALENLTESK